MTTTPTYRDYGHEAQAAAEAHLEACHIMLSIEDGDDYYADAEEAPQWPESMGGPFCGCETCIVREVLVAAWPIVEEFARDEILAELTETAPVIGAAAEKILNPQGPVSSLAHTPEVRIEVAARAIHHSRLLGTIDWDRLSDSDRREYRTDAQIVVDALDAHAGGCTWTAVTEPGAKGAYPFVVCELCGATGWQEHTVEADES